jgi:hypothetical protein
MSLKRTSYAYQTAYQPSPVRYRPVIVWWIYALFIVLYAILLPWWQSEAVPFSVHSVAICIAAVGCLPLAVWFTQPNKQLPIFELICVAYFLRFVLPIYFFPNEIGLYGGIMQLSWEGAFHTLVLVAVGIAAMIVGYYLVSTSPLKTHFPAINLPFESGRVRTYIAGALLLGLVLQIITVTNASLISATRIQAIVNIILKQYTLAIIVLTYVTFREKERSPASVALLAIFTGIGFVNGLVTGMLWEAIHIPLMVFIMYWFVTRKVPWGLIIPLIPLIFILQDVKAEYRYEVWFGNQHYSLTEKVLLWTELTSERVGDIVTGDFQSETGSVLDQTTQRLSSLHQFIYLQEATPDMVPYFGFRSYEYFLYTWIPRVIWPEKPSPSTFIDQRDKLYLFENPVHSNTSIGIGVLPEAYISFSELGVVVIMFLQGVVFAIIGMLLNRPESEGGIAIYVLLMTDFLLRLGNGGATMIFGSLVQHMIIYIIIIGFFATNIFSRPLLARSLGRV